MQELIEAFVRCLRVLEKERQLLLDGHKHEDGCIRDQVAFEQLAEMTAVIALGYEALAASSCEEEE